jgi:hypothetical protein
VSNANRLDPAQGFLFDFATGLRKIGRHWFECRDGNDQARAIFQRHYSHRSFLDGRQPKLFVGPGTKVVLVTQHADALFVWRRFKDNSGQEGVNCAVFRNESDTRSSDLILDAEEIAWRKWPGERLYTYVNPKRIRSRNPGACFKAACWRVCGVTKWQRLLVLEKLP